MANKLALKLAGSVALAATFAVVVPVASHLTGDLLLGATVAKADQGSGGGKGGQGGQGSGGQGSGGQGSGGQGGKASKAEGSGGGSGSSGISGSDLGRLNMARAFLSPGFDPTKIDDPLAPLKRIIAYSTEIMDGNYKSAAQALADAATAPISEATVTKLNDLLGINPSWDGMSLADFAALAQSLNKNEEEE